MSTATEATARIRKRDMHWARKPRHWGEVPPAPHDPALMADVAELPVLDAEAARPPSAPLDEYAPGWHPGVTLFVLRHVSGHRYLVDTQGYDYARYVLALPGGPPPGP